MTDQDTASIDHTTNARWAVQQWSRFWSNPILRGDTSVLAADIVGHWPDGRVLHGIEDYVGRLINLGTLVPDIRLDPAGTRRQRRTRVHALARTSSPTPRTSRRSSVSRSPLPKWSRP
jgi:hypothetical protein